MITQKQQKEMLDYIVSKLEGNYSNVDPMTRKLSHGIDTNYIKVDDGLILLVDKFFLVKEGINNKNTLKDIYAKAINFSKEKYNNCNVGFIFYKDGKNFFRAAAPKHYYKSKGLSLKNYSEKEIKRIIFFRPEEKFVYDIKGILQYYQPKSEKLEEGIITYEFEPVIFDYSHIDPRSRFKPQNRISKKDHIWINGEFTNENIKVSNGIIISYKN
ncbi:MAG: hypothetical protein QXK76_00410 [Candidatus Woesearchaeota archaeon]